MTSANTETTQLSTWLAGIAVTWIERRRAGQSCSNGKVQPKGRGYIFLVPKVMENL